MNLLRCALCTSLLAATLAVLAWTSPATAQEVLRTPPAPADGNYAGTDPEGNYQKALDAAILRAHDILSRQGGQVVSDLSFTWRVHSVLGARGGLTGRRDITVVIHVGN